jgi:hypothetical protein
MNYPGEGRGHFRQRARAQSVQPAAPGGHLHSRGERASNLGIGLNFKTAISSLSCNSALWPAGYHRWTSRLKWISNTVMIELSVWQAEIPWSLAVYIHSCHQIPFFRSKTVPRCFTWKPVIRIGPHTAKLLYELALSAEWEKQISAKLCSPLHICRM